jgi:CRP/FNR family transcriptional regulator, cyclic AMP receptor protein
MPMKPANYNDIKYLRNIPVFCDLADQQLLQIQAKTILRSYTKGTVIFMEGDPGDAFYYVQTGKVKIVKTSDDGREHIIHILVPGDLFAEVLLFNNRPYPATAVAVEDSRIGVIRNTDLEQLVMQNNDLALQLIRALSRRLLYAQEKIKRLALSDVKSRTAAVLLKLSREQGVLRSDGHVDIQLDLSRQDLAELVGTTRETVTRTLSALKKDQIVNFEGHTITILAVRELENLTS